MTDMVAGLDDLEQLFATMVEHGGRRIAKSALRAAVVEIAREMTNPALAAKSVEQALKLETKLAAGQPVLQATGRALTTGGVVNALAPESESTNALAP